MSNKYPGGIITSGANAGYSVAFDGTGDYLTVADNTALDMEASNFTMDAFVYVTSTISANITVFSKRASNAVFGGVLITCQTSNTPILRATTANASWDLVNATSSVSLVVGQWNHIAVARSGTSWAMWVNGVRGISVTASGTVSNNAAAFGIGANADGSEALQAGSYISNARVVKGTAVYDPTATSINVPTQLLAITNTSLLTCNSPAIVDQSSNNFTITANGNAAVSTFTPFTGTQLVPNPNTLANTQGVWSISDAAYWMSQNKWPMPPSYPLQSLRFNSADSAYLTRTPTSTSNRQTFTWSGWVKIGKNPYSTGGYLFSSRQSGTDNFGININSSMQLVVDGAIGGTAINLITTPVYRDSSAWYHIVLAVDTTQATSTNRVKLYVNGTQVTAFGTATYPTQSNTSVNLNTAIHNVSGYNNASNYFDGYMADVNFIDGQALTPSSFGANDPNTGVWSPVPYSGTYGTNGFRLSFQDNTGTTATTLGKDWSGQGNNWTPNNFSVAAGSGNDSLTDGPTNWGIDYGNGGEVRGNFATINPLMTLQFSQTYTNGNLECTGNYAYVNAQSTICVSSGKWYAEAVFNVKNSALLTIGAFNKNISNYIGNSGENGSVGYWTDGTKTINGTATAYGATYGVNDVIGVAMDVSGNSITFYKNGVSQGAISYTFDSSGAWGFLTSGGGTFASGDKVTWNFGQRPFAYPAPSGFKVLCTTNLPIPTVGATSTTQADDYFNAVAYSGNSSTQTITTGFQPDLVWIKSRSTADVHTLQNVISGARYYLISNSTAAEATQPDSDGVSSFTSTGFSLGFTDSDAWNKTGNTYISWSWKAGGTGVSNTAGSITSTVSASTTAGFSVVAYTGTGANATVGHGLGVAPRMIIIKSRSQVRDWIVYHASIGNTGAMFLNSTNSTDTNSAYWNNTTPTSTVFSIGTTLAGNSSGATQIAYCFAEISSFSKFGSYTGNASTDGPFVYCGFRPKYIMIKNSSALGSWWIEDTSRSPYNVASNKIAAESSAVESTGFANFDFLSNGFKVRNSGTELNGSGNTIIFMAFAEAPFNYSRAR